MVELSEEVAWAQNKRQQIELQCSPSARQQATNIHCDFTVGVSSRMPSGRDDSHKFYLTTYTLQLKLQGFFIKN